MNGLVVCRQSVSSLGAPLQVVPDIDDQVSPPEHLQEVRKTLPLPLLNLEVCYAVVDNLGLSQGPRCTSLFNVS